MASDAAARAAAVAREAAKLAAELIYAVLMCVERQVERVKKYGGWGCRCNVRGWSGEDVETTGESPTVGRVGLGQKR